MNVALRAASILKNRVLLYLFNFLQVAKLGYLLRFEPREYARQLSFENAVECTSQRVNVSNGRLEPEL